MNIKKILPIFIVIFLIIGGWYISQRNKIEGKVVNGITENPIENVEIKVGEKTNTTNKQGEFSLTTFGNDQKESLEIKAPEKYEKIEPIENYLGEDLSIKLYPNLKYSYKEEGVSSWKYLHPDDKERWEKEKYIDKEENIETENSINIDKIKIKKLDSWINPVNGKEYQNVFQVWEMIDNQNNDFLKDLTSQYWKKENGQWYFFTRRHTKSEKNETLSKIKTQPFNLISIEEALKKPYNSKSKNMFWTGYVVDIIEHDNKTLIQLREMWTDNDFFALYEGSTKLFPGDFAAIKGTIEMFTNFKTQAGWNMSAIVVRAFEVKRADF